MWSVYENYVLESVGLWDHIQLDYASGKVLDGSQI